MNTAHPSRTAVKILIVDDQSTIRRIVKSQLASLGFTTIAQAASAEEAIDKLHTNNFSLIISDWHMPEMSGFELLQYVRSSTIHEKTPFILLTTERERDNVLRAAQSRVTFYLAKPFTTEVLEKSVLNAIGFSR